MIKRTMDIRTNRILDRADSALYPSHMSSLSDRGTPGQARNQRPAAPDRFFSRGAAPPIPGSFRGRWPHALTATPAGRSNGRPSGRRRPRSVGFPARGLGRLSCRPLCPTPYCGHSPPSSSSCLPSANPCRRFPIRTAPRRPTVGRNRRGKMCLRESETAAGAPDWKVR